VLLNEQGVKKRYASDFEPTQAEQVFDQARALVRAMRDGPGKAG
jgi:uncharacterized metal-binding protein